MPTYQYVCTGQCGQLLEAVQSFSDAPLDTCPTCGGRLRKKFSAVGVVFKGSGFYKTDSRASSGGSGRSAGKDGSGESGTTAKSGGDSSKTESGGAAGSGTGSDKTSASGSGDSGGSGKAAGSSGSSSTAPSSSTA